MTGRVPSPRRANAPRSWRLYRWHAFQRDGGGKLLDEALGTGGLSLCKQGQSARVILLYKAPLPNIKISLASLPVELVGVALLGGRQRIIGFGLAEIEVDERAGPFVGVQLSRIVRDRR